MQQIGDLQNALTLAKQKAGEGEIDEAKEQTLELSKAVLGIVQGIQTDLNAEAN